MKKLMSILRTILSCDGHLNVIALHRAMNVQMQINEDLAKRIAKLENKLKEVDCSDISTEDYL